MCGIAGVVAPAGARPRELADLAARMAAPLHHRGPDATATWADESAGVAFGHTRLAIIDLSPAGAQPMTSASGRWTLVYNGEIYNHRELRRDLESGGCRFRGHSDTEVVIEAVDRWGVRGACERFNGMFAFAAWDDRDHLLVLARDRLGEKPLYHTRVGNRFVFASELAAFRAVAGWSPSIDHRALALYLRHTFVPHPFTIFDGVHQLPPGAILEIDDSGVPRGEPNQYWSLADAVHRGFGRRLRSPMDDEVDAVEALLGDAVARRLVADVPVGAFLSGGVDSTTIAALARANGPVRTFTVRVPSAGLDESASAAAVARHLGTEHETIDLGNVDALAVVRRVPSMYGEPFADPSAIPTALVCEAARQRVTVCLSGDGGDEVFGGYNRYVLGRAVWPRLHRVPHRVRRRAAMALRSTHRVTWERAGTLLPARIGGHDPASRARKLATLLEADTPSEWWTSLAAQWNGSLPLPRNAEVPDIATATELPTLADPVEALMWFDTCFVLPDDMLVKVDRASMAASLEVRVPFLDHRVVEHAWTLPVASKIRDGRGKAIVRDVLARHVPPELVDRPKTGFDPPVAAWLRGPLRAWGDELLDPARLRGQGLLDADAARAAWNDHQSGRADRSYEVWTLLVLQAWLEDGWATVS